MQQQRPESPIVTGEHSIIIIIIIIINPLTVRVVGAPQMLLQPVFPTTTKTRTAYCKTTCHASKHQICKIPKGASSTKPNLKDVPLVEFMHIVLTHMPGEITAGESGLCHCVPCLSSAIISLCLFILRQHSRCCPVSDEEICSTARSDHCLTWTNLWSAGGHTPGACGEDKKSTQKSTQIKFMLWVPLTHT